VTVVLVNDAPTLDLIGNLTVANNAGPQTVNLTGISSGAPDENQSLTVQATSGFFTVIPTPTINYTSPANSGTLTFTPNPNATGVVVITVRVMDNGGTDNGGVNSVTRNFSVRVTGSGNSAPTLRIDLAPPNAVLSWSTGSGAGWVLQQNASVVNGAGWSPVGVAPTIVGGRYTVTVPINNLAQFYRLCSGCAR
jgi:hypothetical protein